MIELDLTPDVNLVQAIRAEAKMTLAEAFSEFIDNALDAGATTVSIDVARDEIRISDNGRGCADLEKMLKLGTHNPDGRRIGRYGVGFNTAAIWLAHSVALESIHEGKRYRAKLTWDDIRPGWRILGPEPEDADGAASGMNIRIYDLISRRQSADIAARLSARYPFLAGAGKTIRINGAPLVGSQLPALDRAFTAEGEWEGRAYRLTAGLVARITPPWKHGFTVMLRDRILAEGLSDGCGQYSKHGFFAAVELLEGVELEDGAMGQPWPVEKTKTGLTDTIRLFLESLLPTVEPLLKAAETESSNLVLRGLEQQLSGTWLNEAVFGPGRRVRRKGEGGGPGGTVGGSGGQSEIDETKPGMVRVWRGVGRNVRVRFAPLESEADIAVVGHNSTRTECVLNELHPFVRTNRDLGLLHTKMLVAQMVVTHWLDDSSRVRSRIVNQLSLPLDGPRFDEVQRAMARVLSHLNEAAN